MLKSKSMVILLRSKSIDDNPSERHWSSKASLPIVSEEDSKSSVLEGNTPSATLKPRKEQTLTSLKGVTVRQSKKQVTRILKSSKQKENPFDLSQDVTNPSIAITPS